MCYCALKALGAPEQHLRLNDICFLLWTQSGGVKQSFEVVGNPTGDVDLPRAVNPPPEKPLGSGKGPQKHKIPLSSPDANLGVHIANRLVEIGCTTCFAVPGDFNLLLLDQLLKQPELDMVWCCNELNAGYAADGYARKRGVGCVCVTFCVGGFSVINAVAGAYSEDLPVIVISGGPNSQDHASNHILHHTTGLNEYGQQLRAFKECTCCQVVIQHIEDAHMLLDTAISEALLRRKPVYIEVACNLADLTHPSFARPPVPYALAVAHTNTASLEAAVEVCLEWLGRAVKPVLLQGVRTRPARTRA
ncbi:hypothetical protein Vretifemale_2997, partial [Volvox reticuliferus]